MDDKIWPLAARTRSSSKERRSNERGATEDERTNGQRVYGAAALPPFGAKNEQWADVMVVCTAALIKARFYSSIVSFLAS